MKVPDKFINIKAGTILIHPVHDEALYTVKDKFASYRISNYEKQTDGSMRFDLYRAVLGGRNSWLAPKGSYVIEGEEKPPKDGTNYLLCKSTDRFDPYGQRLYKLSVIIDGAVHFECDVVSGQPGLEGVHPKDDYSGSMRPCPQGIFKLGPVEYGKFGSAIGDIWIDVLGTDPRKAIGIHLDANRAYSPGSAGCICPTQRIDMVAIANLIVKYPELKTIHVDHRLT